MKAFFCILLLSVFHGSQGKDLVHNVCTQAAKDDKDLKYDYCKHTLQAIPVYERPNMQQLCMALIDLVSTNIWETREEIIRIFRDEKNLDVYTENILDKCFEYYGDAVSQLYDALKSFRSKKYGEANVKASDALTKVTACSDAFGDTTRLVSPLKQRCEDLRKYCEITVDIIAMVG